MTTAIKDVEYYMALRYPILLTPEEEGWSARIAELQGCVGAGDTIQEALEMLEDARRGWIEVSLMYDDPIPEPKVTM